MAINPILAGQVQMAYTTSIRNDRKIPDNLVEENPPPVELPVKAPETMMDLIMSEAQAIVKLAQTNATMLKTSGEIDAVLRLVITPPSIKFDYEVGRPVPKDEPKAVSLGATAEAPVLKTTKKEK